MSPGLSRLILLPIVFCRFLDAQTAVTVSLSSANNPSVYGAPVTLVASLTPSSATGRVTFYDGANVLGVRAVTGGQASLQTVLPISGVRTLRAHYSGAPSFLTADSASLLQTVTPVSAGQLVSGTTVNVGTSPVAIASGDLNGDGITDLVVANGGSGTISVLLGNGSGGFAPAATYPVGTSPSSVVLGDFNGDGYLDVAVTLSSTNTANILLGYGNGTLGSVGPGFGVGGNPAAIAAGDFNGDGIVDLATANYNDGTASVLLGKGDGTFQPVTTFGADAGAIAITVYDLNLDGYADLAVANATAGTVSVLLGKGDGTFQTAAGYPTAVGVPSLDPVTVVAADLNGDGIPDLAVANLAGSAAVLSGQTTAGLFNPPVSYTAGAYASAVIAADVNGDGAVDLVGLSLGLYTANVLMNIPYANLGQLSANAYNVGSFPVAVLAGDFNGDGRLDLAVVNELDDTVSILLGGLPPSISCSPSPVTFTVTLPSQANLSQTCSVTSSPTGLTLDAFSLTTISANLNAAQTPETLTVEADVIGLAPGTVTGTVVLVDPASQADIRVPVVINVAQSVCTYTFSSTSATVPAAGSAGSFTLTNSRGCAATATSDSAWLTVTWGPVSIGSNNLHYPTTQTMYYAAASNPGAASRTGIITIGSQTFTVTQAGTSLQVVSVNPASASGVSQSFSFQFVDSAGPTGTTAQMWFTPAFSSDHSSSCLLIYTNGQIALLGDDGISSTQSPLATAGTLSNYQCSVDTGSATAVWSGSNLTVNLTVTFQPSYAGAQQIWMDISLPAADSGWFKEGYFISTAPPNVLSVVSVKPSAGASGAMQDFVFRYADTSGPSNLQTVWFWFTPSFNGGNAAHSCQFYYNTAQHTFNLLDDTGTTWMTANTGGVVLQNSQCSLATRNVVGTSGTSDIYYSLAVSELKFAPSFSGVQQIWAYATASSTNNSGWRQLGTFTVASPLQVAYVQPNSGLGAQQTFVVAVSDKSVQLNDGYEDLQSVDFVIDSTPSLAGACWVHINTTTGPPTLYLGSDNGLGYTLSTGIGMGFSGLLQNSQCTVDVSHSTVTNGSDPYTLIFNLALSFKSPFSGARNLYVGMANPAWSLPLQLSGTWNVAGVTPPVLQDVSVTPSSGASPYLQATLVYSDSYGYGDLTSVQVLFNTTPTAAGGCSILANPLAQSLQLMNDAGNAWLGPIQMNSGSTLQNSQCTVQSLVSASGFGNTYTLSNLYITFTPAFAGPKNIYAAATGTSGATTGWQMVGTWNTGNPSSSNVSVTPNAGTGAGDAFTFTFSDTGGVGDLGTVGMLFGTVPYPRNLQTNPTGTCYIQYSSSSSWLSLSSDTSTGGGGGAGSPGSNSVLSNSQCSLDLSRSSVVKGSNLVVTVSIQFAAAYQGTQGISMQSVDSVTGSFTPMQQMGSWNVSFAPTVLTLSVTPNPALYGQPVTLTGTLSSSTASGKITFYDGANVLGDAAVNGGTATLGTLLPAGTRSLRAYYSGDTYNKLASSTAVSEVVSATPGTAFVSTALGPFPAGATPAAMAVADLNGDGRADLVVANSGDHTFTVLLASASGGFVAAPGSPFNVGSAASYGLQPAAVAVGDFNGDGHPDLAFANKGNNSIWILYGDGNGGFTPAASSFPAGASPDAIVAGDFNGDGNADLAIANRQDNTVSIFLSDGKGGWTQVSTSPFYSGGTGPVALAVGDFDGDGNSDLAVADGSSLRILLGSVTGAMTLAANAYPATGATAVVAADFNGDGKLDLAYTNAGSNNVTVLFNSGGGNFQAASGSPFAVGAQPSGLVVSDFNGDGVADLAVSNQLDGTVTVLIGGGSGNFTAMSGSPFAAGSGPVGIVAGDFNGDGRADLATAGSTGNNVTVLLAAPVVSGPASLPAGTVNAAYPTTTLTATGGTGTFTWSATGLPPGLSLDSGSGRISGTPTSAVGSPFTVNVTATAGSLTLSRTYGVTIFSLCDLNQDGSTSASDVQTIVNETLGKAAATHDLNHDNSVNVLDVQIIINAAVGGGCAAH